METIANKSNSRFDKTNAIIAGIVFLIAFIVYRLTVAPTFSFWDCGEFIACSYILGIPHPPGWPLFVVLGRVFSILPIATDISLRINMISVITSALVALFGYLTIVRMIKLWYAGDDFLGWKRVIAYMSGFIGGLFMAFSATHWGNAVEAEVLGLSMMIMTIILWLILQYFETPDAAKSRRIMLLICFLGTLGIGAHLTTFLIMPIAAIFFILKKDAPRRAWIAVCAFFVMELLSIILVADGRGGLPIFILLTLIWLGITAYIIYHYINWPVLIGLACLSMIMIGFYQFLFALIAGLIIFISLAFFARESDWKSGIVILLLAVVGFSFHAFVPIRSQLDPRIDENNTKRSFQTFVDFLDRKQYGRQSMVGRMFQRRGTWSHQFGRHPNMGFWSYFEEQYSTPKLFGILFLLGMFGVYLNIRKKLEVGLPFLIFLLLASVGLILYMNFADGIRYNEQTGDAYLEVRNRDYFFTPAYLYFGMALGLGVAAIMEILRAKTLTAQFSKYRKPAMGIASLLVLLPSLALAHNYFPSDHSRNYYPYIYAHNILATCEKDAILFTSGDNDTFPLWCIQEVYNFRKDVRVVNLSLFNTDWYIHQMKNQYQVPMSLNDDQILLERFEYEGQEYERPKEPYYDRARKRKAYLVPVPYEGRILKLQDVMVDDVVLSNNWKYPIYFSSEPYSESPLKLRDFTVADGILYKMMKNPPERKVDAEDGFRLYTQVYRFDGLNDPNIFRDENMSGVMLTFGYNTLRIAEEFRRTGQPERAKEILRFTISKYPEFMQTYLDLAQMYRRAGDSLTADSITTSMEQTLETLHKKNPGSLFYTQDLGLAKYYRGAVDSGLALLWEAFYADPGSSYSYHKLIPVLYELRRSSDIIRATELFADYKVNRTDPLVQQIIGQTQSITPPNEP